MVAVVIFRILKITLLMSTEGKRGGCLMMPLSFGSLVPYSSHASQAHTLQHALPQMLRCANCGTYIQ